MGSGPCAAFCYRITVRGVYTPDADRRVFGDPREDKGAGQPEGEVTAVRMKDV